MFNENHGEEYGRAVVEGGDEAQQHVDVPGFVERSSLMAICTFSKCIFPLPSVLKNKGYLEVHRMHLYYLLKRFLYVLVC